MARPDKGNNLPRFTHPPFSKTVAAQFPTPLIQDLVIVVAKEVNTPAYEVETYGAPHPDSEKFPDHKLALIQLSEDGLKAKWFYVADRDDQDLYNYALKFQAEDHTSAIYIRQYVLPRDGYAPLDNGTVDSADDECTLIHEEVTGSADGELASLYIKVVRVFEHVVGPLLDGETNDVPKLMPDKFILDESTEITEQQVAAGTAADAVTTEGSSSTVTPVDTVLSKKTNKDVTLNFRTDPLPSYEETPQQQIGSIAEQVVDEGTALPALSATVIQSSSLAVGDGKAIQRVVTVPDVFGENTFSETRPDVVPEKFRVAVPTAETTVVSAGTAANPTLGLGDLEKSEEQVTEFKMRARTKTRAGLTLPISLESKDTSGVKQEVTVTDTLQLGTDPQEVPSATQDVKIQNLGDGSVVQTVEAVPDVFSDIEYSTRLADVVPEKFRTIIPTTVVAETTAGTAAPPTLGTGDLDSSDHQLTEFTHRTTTVNRDPSALPVSLTESKITEKGQVETIVETLDNGLQTVTGSATTIEAEVHNLGNNTSLKHVGTVTSVFADGAYEKSIPDVIPVEFRVAVPTLDTEETSAGTASTNPTLATGDLSKRESQLTAFIKRVRTVTRSAITLPVSLINTLTNRVKQLVTQTRTLQDQGTSTAAPDALTDVKVTNLGNGTELEEVETIDSVFGEDSFGKSIPDVVPERFRVAVPTETTSAVTAGTAAMPTLGAGDLTAESKQETEFTKRDSLTTRAGITLPVTLSSSKMTPEGQVESVDETLDTGLQTIAPDATTAEADVQNLGDGTSLKKVGTVPDVFGREEFETEIPDVIPVEFRVAVPTTTTGIDEAGTASAPTLATGDLSISEEQKTEFVKRTTTRTRSDITLPVTLESTKLTAKGQIETVEATLDTGLQVATGSATTIESDVRNLGNGTSLLTTGTVPSVFGDGAYEKSIPDVIPIEFRVAVPTLDSEVSSAGTASTNPTLATGDLSKRESQLTSFIKRVRTVTRSAITLPVSLINTLTNQVKQLVTQTRTLQTQGTSTAAPDALTDVKVTNLGNGQELEEVETIESVFGQDRFGTEIPDVVPERFRVAVPTNTTSAVTAGTAAAPTLGTGDLKAESEQVTEFTKRDNLTTRAGISLPVSLSSSRVTAEGQVESITETLDTGLQTVTGSATTVEADVQNLGDGTSLKKVGTVPTVFSEAKFERERPDVAPPEFRALLETTTTATTSSGTAADPTLGTGELHKTSDQVTTFKKRESTVARDLLSLPASLVDTATDRDKQVQTVTKTIETSGTSTATPDALTEVEVKQLGDGTEIESVTTVPEVFGRERFTKQRPDVTPPEFRALLETEITVVESAGTAAAPTLGTGELDKSSEQLTEFTKRDSLTARDVLSLPQTLVDTETTGVKQVETVTKTIETSGASTAVPDATTSVVVKQLGDGTEIEEVRTVPDVFARDVFEKTVPDVVPVRFRVAVPVATAETTAAGTASAPTLGAGDLSKRDEQTTEFEHRTSTTTRSAITLPVSLTSTKLTAKKQVETVVETLDTGLQTITGSATTVEADVQNLGDGTSLKTVGTVPAVFADGSYEKTIPDVVPIEFRVAVPTLETEESSAGTASTNPTLATGDLSKRETQIDAFVKRVRTLTRSAITLPVSLVNTLTNRVKQLVTVTRTLEDEGTSTAAPDALTDVKVTNLGNGQELEEVETIESVFGEDRFAKEIPDVVPTRFRVAIPTSTTSSIVAGTAADPTLGTGDLRAESEQVTEFTKRDSLTTRAGVSLPVSLSSSKFTAQGQVESITETLATGLQTITGSATLVEADVQSLGDGTSLKTAGTVASVFAESKFARERPDVAPPEFRALLETTTQSTVSAGTAADPTLGTGELRKTSDQIGVYKKLESTTARDVLSLPQTLIDTETTRVKQVETVTKTIETSGDSTAVPDATTDVVVKQLGDGTEIEEVRTVDAVFGDNLYQKSIPDVVPQRFRVAVPTATTEVTAAGTAAAPTLGTGDLEKSESQITEFTKKSRTTNRSAVSYPVVLTSEKLTRDGQVETVTETLDDSIQSVTGSSTTVEADVQNLGDGTSLKTVGTVPNVFGREQFGEEIPDIVPVKFRVAVPLSTTAVDAAGTAADPTLGTGDLSITEEQVNEFVKRTTTKTRAGVSMPVSLVGKDTDPDRQIVTVTQTYKTSGSDATPSALQTVEVENLGDGRVVQTVKAVPEVFAANTHSKSILDLIPASLRAAVPMFGSDVTSAGTASTTPSLGAGELSRAETQVNEFVKRVKVESLGSVSVPTSITNQELTKEYGGGVAQTVITLDDSAETIDEGFTVIDSKVIDLGNGYFVKETKELVDDTWPVLESRLWDENMRLEYDETQEIVAPGTAEDADPGGSVFAWTSEVKAIDKWHSRKINTSKPTPDYTDAASALVTYEYKPFRFPGLLYYGVGYYVRAADATLVQHRVKTWWEKSGSTPTVAVDEIILDNVVINDLSNKGLQYSGPVLHDALSIGILSYPATTPSYTEYALGTVTGSALSNFASLYSPGDAGGYVIGDTVTISGGGHSMSVDVTYVYDVPGGATGLIGATTNPDPSGTFPSGTYGPIAASGGSGSGAFFNVFSVEIPTYTGPGWIGTYKIIGASVTPEREKDIWKIRTEEVVMR